MLLRVPALTLAIFKFLTAFRREESLQLYLWWHNCLWMFLIQGPPNHKSKTNSKAVLQTKRGLWRPLQTALHHLPFCANQKLAHDCGEESHASSISIIPVFRITVVETYIGPLERKILISGHYIFKNNQVYLQEYTNL